MRPNSESPPAPTPPAAASSLSITFCAKTRPSPPSLPRPARITCLPPTRNTVVDAHLTAGGLSLPHQGTLKVGTVEPRTVIVNLPWTDNAAFESICTNVLLRKSIGGIDYWVCYGAEGDAGEVTLKRKVPGTLPAQLDFTYPAGDIVKTLDLDSGDGHRARFLIMNTGMTNRTWFAHDRLYVGPSFVLADGSVEFPPEGGRATVYAADGESPLAQAAVASPVLPALAPWSWRDAAGERAGGSGEAGWLPSEGPQPMESYDGFQNRYGWYRTTLHRDAAGPVSLHFGGSSGTFAAFLNGQPASLDHLDAKAGDNSLAILAKVGARPKTTYGGPVGKRNARGLWGGVSDAKAPTPVPVAWKRWREAKRDANPDEVAKPDYDDSAWQAVDPASLTGKIHADRGNNWYRGTFTITPAQVDSLLEGPVFGPAAKPARTVVYLNGNLLEDRTVEASKLLVAGKNTVLVEIQSRLGEDTGELALSLWHEAPLTHGTWYFHGGLDDLEETAVVGRVTNWNEFLHHAPWQPDGAAAPAQPVFWKSSFTYHRPPETRETLGLLTEGLKAGHVWLNGHNLGECPQKVPMYLPECWLNDGPNDLVVFDLHGARPEQVELSRYEIFAVKAAER